VVVAVVAIRAERDRQEREIEERRWATLREERIRAYATMARLTKTMNPEAEEDPVPALAEAHSEIGMLAGDRQLKAYADALLGDWIPLWEVVQREGRRGAHRGPGGVGCSDSGARLFFVCRLLISYFIPLLRHVKIVGKNGRLIANRPVELLLGQPNNISQVGRRAGPAQERSRLAQVSPIQVSIA